MGDLSWFHKPVFYNDCLSLKGKQRLPRSLVCRPDIPSSIGRPLVYRYSIKCLWLVDQLIFLMDPDPRIYNIFSYRS